MNIADYLDRSAQQFPDQPAIIFERQHITYRQLREQVDRVAGGLLHRGIGVGDRIALFLPNIPEFAIGYLAAQKIGTVAVAVNSMLTAEEVRYVVEDSGARLLFTTADLLPRLQGVLGSGLTAEQVIVCEGEAVGFTSLAALGDADGVRVQPLALEPDAPAAILYTSGTTGQQKGATLSHGNIVANVTQTQHCLRTSPQDRLLLFLPLFHCFGQNFIMNTGLAAGATLVLHRRFELDAVLDSIERDQVTMLFAVPTVFIALLNAEVPAQRLASVRYCFSAAAPLPVEVFEQWKAGYGHDIHEGYGLTESSPFASYNHIWQLRPGSVGTPLPMVDVRIVAVGDEQDRPALPGVWGEVCLRGPNVMLGYWNRPAETAETLRGGWLRTGDIGYLDEDGYLYIVDRTKDMINAAGFKIWPREVEEILYQHPAIQECAVVGVSDPTKGEAAKAYIVLRPGAALTAEALEVHCRAHLATYKVPRIYEFISRLPKNATGKILKRLLRDESNRAPAASLTPGAAANRPGSARRTQKGQIHAV